MNVKADIFEGMQYAVRFPEHYNEGMQYPILLFLHGAGTRGNDINNILTHSFLRRPEKWQDFKFIIVAPLCHKNTWFDHFETLERFALFVANQAYTDKNRIYLTGNSMGGYGTWQLAMSMPELFAAIAPLCGGGTKRFGWFFLYPKRPFFLLFPPLLPASANFCSSSFCSLLSLVGVLTTTETN